MGKKGPYRPKAHVLYVRGFDVRILPRYFQPTPKRGRRVVLKGAKK